MAKKSQSELGDPVGDANEQVERLFAAHFLYHRVPQLLKELETNHACVMEEPDER